MKKVNILFKNLSPFAWTSIFRLTTVTKIGDECCNIGSRIAAVSSFPFVGKYSTKTGFFYIFSLRGEGVRHLENIPIVLKVSSLSLFEIDCIVF